jgi:hypothetical protein
MKTVNRSAQCHVFAQLPNEDCKPFCPMSRIPPVTASSRFADKCFTAMSFGNNGNSFAVGVQSDMCVYTHIVHSIETVVGQKK